MAENRVLEKDATSAWRSYNICFHISCIITLNKALVVYQIYTISICDWLLDLEGNMTRKL
jgi:hypothetical protein